ncbi:MAG: hypothetical protein IKI38_05390 [Mogibacterium sp.]|nr:hypothetical protein [Mogibacterium sp.]
MGSKKKKGTVIAVCLIILASAAAAVIYLNYNTILFERMFAKAITLDQAEEISFHYKKEDALRLKTYCFEPEESGEYQFILSDISTSDKTALGMYVANYDFTEFMVADNYFPEDDVTEIGGSTFIQKGEKCYICSVIIPVSDDEAEPFDGSFTMLVSRKPEYTEPPLLTEEEDALLVIKPEDRACARFIPQETGYFRFDTSIVSADASEGFSSVSSIISPDNLKTQITEGIAYLEKDKEYYVWVTVNETGDSESEVSLSVNPMTVLKVNGACEITVTEDTMIEYHAEGDGYMAVYSVSDGNPNALIYEKAGVALRTDEDGEDSLSGNDKDFAMVFSQKDGRNYCVGVYGDIGSECKVYILPYIGDGSSLTLDDVDLSVLEKLEAEAAAEAEAEPDNASEDTPDADGTDGAETETDTEADTAD